MKKFSRMKWVGRDDFKGNEVVLPVYFRYNKNIIDKMSELVPDEEDSPE